MASPATDPEDSTPPPSDEQAGNVVPIREGDPRVALHPRAEGGLTLRFAVDLPRLPALRAGGDWTHQQILNAILVAAVVLLALAVGYDHFLRETPVPAERTTGLLRENVATSFNPSVEAPTVATSAYVDALASIIGDVALGERVYVAPFASIRGDEGQPIHIGAGSNVQDGVVIHALETFDGSKPVEKNMVTVKGKKYAVHVGEGVSLAHQSQVHGPAAVGDHTFVGMQALVFRAIIGENVVIEPGAKVIGVTVAPGRYVPAGLAVTTQEAADALPVITESYPFAKLNDGVLEVNHELADAYRERASGHAPAAAGAAEPPAGH